MTIIYQYRVATTSLGGFLKLLRAWKGSVYKLLYKELFIFITMYASISLTYRLALSPSQKRQFEGIVLELYAVSSSIPLSFVLGFYVTIIVQRWWQQFRNIPWPDRTLFIMCTYLHGFDDKSRMMRRSVARYMMFGLILICRAVSVAVMKRFPTMDHIVEAGFITKEEAAFFEGVQCQYIKFWVPMMWANNVLVSARREGTIQTEMGLRLIVEQLADFRDKCSLCFVYDWITVPLVYTQVVTFATYSFFAVCLLGQQYLDPTQQYSGFEKDYYIPGFTILQFLFYMGWLKVAEQMINPFGEDDDDYDINWLLDRHTAVAFALVDQCYGRHPSLIKDPFWNDVAPDVPYTESSMRSIRPNFEGSTFNVARPSIDVEKMVIPDHEEVIHHGWPHVSSRGKGSITGSLLSLFPFRHLRHHGNADSQTTLESAGSTHGRFLSVPNGRLPYHYPRKESKGDRRVSFDVPRRERANTDCDFRDENKRERKLSLPFSINLFTKSKQQKNMSDSPKLSRFTVEPVKEQHDNGGIDSEVKAAARSRRSGHAHMATIYNSSEKVSRVPHLSAIEEGNTITSMRQMLLTPQQSIDSSNSHSISGDSSNSSSSSDSNSNNGNASSSQNANVDNNTETNKGDNPFNDDSVFEDNTENDAQSKENTISPIQDTEQEEHTIWEDSQDDHHQKHLAELEHQISQSLVQISEFDNSNPQQQQQHHQGPLQPQCTIEHHFDCEQQEQQQMELQPFLQEDSNPLTYPSLPIQQPSALSDNDDKDLDNDDLFINDDDSLSTPLLVSSASPISVSAQLRSSSLPTPLASSSKSQGEGHKTPKTSGDETQAARRRTIPAITISEA